jgi:prepilin-type N-terminal cleavage/methylation domain-containing protein
MNKLKIYSKGFTLIELMVVISIVALLSTIVISTLNSSKEKARIAIFLNGMSDFKSAMEQYRTTNDSYPYALLNNVTGETDELTPNLEGEGVIPNNLGEIPRMPNTDHTLMYTTEDFVMAGIECGDSPAQGFMLMYDTGGQYDDLNLPHVVNAGSEEDYAYCITGN